MDFTSIVKNAKKPSKLGIIGATRGYGYTLLAQMTHVPLLQLRVISSRHTDECRAVLEELDVPEGDLPAPDGCKSQVVAEIPCIRVRTETAGMAGFQLFFAADYAEDMWEILLETDPVLPAGQQLLEVKYDEYLPDFIYRNLQLHSLRQTAFSKYYVCRKYIR